MKSIALQEYTMPMRKYWALGFLGFLGVNGLVGLLHNDWLQSIWVAWFAFFFWFVPEKTDGKTGE